VGWLAPLALENELGCLYLAPIFNKQMHIEEAFIIYAYTIYMLIFMNELVVLKIKELR
jgi:hypothetical protein